MAEVAARPSLERNEELVVASIYQRVVASSLERVWENVYDWEHLPWLHAQAFDSIELLDSGEWGWSARVGFPGGARADIELVADRAAGHYVARTLDGAGAPSEIWTALDPRGPEQTAIRVEFCVSPAPADTLRRLGDGYVEIYTVLWDQDEGMMQTRSRALDRRRSGAPSEGVPESWPAPPAAAPLVLGRENDLRARLPVLFEFAGHGYRLLSIEGEWLVHSTECPHRLGPLEACEVEGGEIVCPWHGYRFDLRRGRSADSRSLRLRKPPRIEIDRARGVLQVCDPGNTA